MKLHFLFGDVTIASDELQIFDIEQWGFFSVPHLLWHGASVYNGHLQVHMTLAPIAVLLIVKRSFNRLSVAEQGVVFNVLYLLWHSVSVYGLIWRRMSGFEWFWKPILFKKTEKCGNTS